MKPNWTKREVNTLVKCLKAGLSAVETAKELDRTTQAIWNKKYKLVQEGVVSTLDSFRDHRSPFVRKKKVVVKTSKRKVTSKRK